VPAAPLGAAATAAMALPGRAEQARSQARHSGSSEVSPAAQKSSPILGFHWDLPSGYLT